MLSARWCVLAALALTFRSPARAQLDAAGMMDAVVQLGDPYGPANAKGYDKLVDAYRTKGWMVGYFRYGGPGSYMEMRFVNPADSTRTLTIITSYSSPGVPKVSYRASSQDIADYNGWISYVNTLPRFTCPRMSPMGRLCGTHAGEPQLIQFDISNKNVPVDQSNEEQATKPYTFTMSFFRNAILP